MAYSGNEKALYLAVALGTAAIIVVIDLNCNCVLNQKTHYMNPSSIIKQDMDKVALNRATVIVRAVPEFAAFFSGPPLCKSQIDKQCLGSDQLY